MITREKGFTFIELLIVMVVLGLVLLAGSEMFVSLLGGYKQQSKIAETNIEGIIGLELLRRDIESAGYGLPWAIPVNTTYQEAPGATVAAAYNDSTANPPRAFMSGTVAAAGYVNGSAYMVVKAINVARNDACGKWTTLIETGGTPTTTAWDPASENLGDSDRVIVISPGATAANSRTLSGPTGIDLGALLRFDGVSTLSDPNEVRLVYGVGPADGGAPLWMPFNRADYYVRTTGTIPGRCAPGTGVLVKAIMSQSDGAIYEVNVLPLLDCVADMQVVTYRDTNGDGSWDTRGNGLIGAAAADALTIRSQLEEVRVYILAHEGQRDRSYTHSPSTILVGESAGLGLGRDFNLATSGITDWQNYRWKVYSLVVRPNNLR